MSTTETRKIGRPPAPVAQRFLSKFKVDDTTGCWNWTCTKGWGGYGRIGIDGKQKAAHRLSYELHCGPIADGLHVCHRCDNRACVNPDHLFLGTNVENLADMDAKGRRAKGSGNGNSKLTDAEVIAIRASKGLSQDQLAARYGVSQSMISQILLGRVWMHLLPPDGPQHALHVTDYYCAMTLARLRAMGACGRKVRKLTDYEFDHSQFSEEQGDGPIY